jgi:hypothetical protein
VPSSLQTHVVLWFLDSKSSPILSSETYLSFSSITSYSLCLSVCVSIQVDKIIYTKSFVQHKIMIGKEYSRHRLELQQGFVLALQKENFRDLK